MKAISAEIIKSKIHTMAFERHDDRSITVLDEKIIPRNTPSPYFMRADEQLIREAYPNLAANTKLFVLR